MADVKTNHARKRPTKFGPAKRKAFLEALAAEGIYHSAALAAGVCYETTRVARRDEPEFEAQCEDAIAQYLRTLRTEAHRRGVEGWIEREEYDPETGELVRVVRKHSDTLLLALMKRHDPDMRDKVDINQKTELSGTVKTPVELDLERVLRQLSPAGRQALRTVIEELAPEGEPQGEEAS